MFHLTFEDHGRHLTDGERRLAEKICADTASELCALLPALPGTVRVYIATHGRVIPQFGYGARAATPDSARFALDPSHASGSAGLMQEHLRAALFHECHHLVRGWVVHGGRPARRFIDGVVHEGLASAFERDAAGHAPPWTNYPDQVQHWVDELLALPVDAPYERGPQKRSRRRASQQRSWSKLPAPGQFFDDSPAHSRSMGQESAEK